MMKETKKRLYGKPTDVGKPFCSELYCGMCNQIPVFDTWDRSTGEIVGVEIGALTGVPIMKIGQEGKREEVLMMTCMGCVQRIQEKMENQLKTIFGGMMRRRPPEEPGQDVGGTRVPSNGGPGGVK